ncbi:hypothetical protein SAMD00019534_041790, partial [Acytostelium subglobosum LB1]|uniref:hypothetical protein n=1 Tax=Acytostelium subglobosum LB1 TaxID=1410327 RepID=UPI000644B668
MSYSVAQPNLSLPDQLTNENLSHRFAHPVESIQLNAHKVEQRLKNYALTNVFGQHMPVNCEIERQIYSQFHRLPTLPSSMVALETVLGLDEDFEFEDYLNDPIMSEKQLPNLHEAMEIKLGLQHPKNLKL